MQQARRGCRCASAGVVGGPDGAGTAERCEFKVVNYAGCRLCTSTARSHAGDQQPCFARPFPSFLLFWPAGAVPARGLAHALWCMHPREAVERVC
jgi:hypothetical protein